MKIRHGKIPESEQKFENKNLTAEMEAIYERYRFGCIETEIGRDKNDDWIKNRRPGNVGGVGNTLEDLLDVDENNMQLPDFGE